MTQISIYFAYHILPLDTKHLTFSSAVSSQLYDCFFSLSISWYSRAASFVKVFIDLIYIGARYFKVLCSSRSF